jgi:putative ABC transport system ATP-binding protein
MAAALIKMEKVVKIYNSGDISVKALKGIDLMVQAGDFIAIMGSSGSGKSTLMNIMGCLDSPTSGEYFLEGINVNGLSPNDRADIRNQKIGFVFQGFNLLPRTSALENVELPLYYDRTGKTRDTSALAVEALTRVGLEKRIRHTSSQLSGGEQQRVAIARAVVNQPSLVLADEPTGNIDTTASIDIMSLFQNLNQQGITIVLITHEVDIAEYAKRTIVLRDGLVVRDAAVPRPRNALLDLRDMRQQQKQHAVTGTN